jgi:hypothetical protein
VQGKLSSDFDTTRVMVQLIKSSKPGTSRKKSSWPRFQKPCMLLKIQDLGAHTTTTKDSKELPKFEDLLVFLKLKSQNLGRRKISESQKQKNLENLEGEKSQKLGGEKSQNLRSTKISNLRRSKISKSQKQTKF